MKAYADKQGDRIFAYIQTPRGTWIRLSEYMPDAYDLDIDLMKDWLASCGFIVIDKAESF